MDIAYAQHTDPGLLRAENQDAMGVFVDGRRHLFVVCDGMGGHHGGRVASQLAVSALGETFERAIADGEPLDPAELLERCVRRANAVVFARADNGVPDPETGESLDGMGTTVVACLVDPDEARAQVAWVGDSRLYQLRDGVLAQLTRDHTVVQRLIDQGRIAPEQALMHPQAGVIARALGVEPRVEVELGEPLELRDQDRLLLCSDGVTTMMDDDVIERFLRDHHHTTAGVELISLARARGGYDNITVQIVQLGHDPHPLAADDPVATASGDEAAASRRSASLFTSVLLAVVTVIAVALYLLLIA